MGEKIYLQSSHVPDFLKSINTTTENKFGEVLEVLDIESIKKKLTNDESILQFISGIAEQVRTFKHIGLIDFIYKKKKNEDDDLADSYLTEQINSYNFKKDQVRMIRGLLKSLNLSDAILNSEEYENLLTALELVESLDVDDLNRLRDNS